VSETLTFLVPRLDQEIAGTYKEPLSPATKLVLATLVVFFHVGGGWALTMVEPVKLVVGDIAPMEVRMVAAEQQAAAQPDLPLEEPPPLPEIKPPPPDLATIVDPPPPDLPPPAFPLAKIDLPPPPELPPPVIPVERPPPPKPKPVQKAAPAHPPAPTQAQPQQQQATAAPAGPPAPSVPKTVSASQLGYLVPPNPIYPQRSRRAGEEGTVMLRVLVDLAGRPSQVTVQKSSGHAALDDSALSAVRAAQFRAYAEGGVPQAVWVLVPINFVLR
jgi:protein TonB